MITDVEIIALEKFWLAEISGGLRQACGSVESGGSRSVQLSEEEADAHLDIAIDFRLASRGGHEVSAGQAFVKSNTTNVALLTFQWAGE
jgi:hypothetical protein